MTETYLENGVGGVEMSGVVVGGEGVRVTQLLPVHALKKIYAFSAHGL